MKKLFLIASLFLTSNCYTETMLLSITINNRTVSQKIEWENDTLYNNDVKEVRLFLDNTIACALFLLSKNAKFLQFRAKIYAEDAKGNLALVAQPNVVAVWNEEINITLTTPDNNLSMRILVSP